MKRFRWKLSPMDVEESSPLICIPLLMVEARNFPCVCAAHCSSESRDLSLRFATSNNRSGRGLSSMTHSEKRGHWLKEGAIGLFTGVLYGFTSVAVGHPFDTIKTKMQAQHGHVEGGGMIASFRKTIRAEGIRGVYRGALPPLLGSGLYRSTQFAVFEALYTKFDKEEWRKSLPYTGGVQYRVVAAAFIASAARATIECPIELVRRQTGQNWRMNELWRGFSLQLLRTSGVMVTYFICIDSIRRHRPETFGHPLGQFLASSCSATLGFWIVWPFEVLKNQVQAGMSVNLSGREVFLLTLSHDKYDFDRPVLQVLRPNLTQRATFLLKQHGLTGLYRGIWPGTLRSMLSNGFSMIVMLTAQKEISTALVATRGTISTRLTIYGGKEGMSKEPACKKEGVTSRRNSLDAEDEAQREENGKRKWTNAEKGFQVCGQFNKFKKPCQRVGACPFHNGAEKAKKEKKRNIFSSTQHTESPKTSISCREVAPILQTPPVKLNPPSIGPSTPNIPQLTPAHELPIVPPPLYASFPISIATPSRIMAEPVRAPPPHVLHSRETNLFSPHLLPYSTPPAPLPPLHALPTHIPHRPINNMQTHVIDQRHHQSPPPLTSLASICHGEISSETRPTSDLFHPTFRVQPGRTSNRFTFTMEKQPEEGKEEGGHQEGD
ncbi:hypothetical protein PROFUN_08543 [Planoprotostelium fungivorum]|uniref:Mitochondrial carrier protein n=1 Tax=Planoprotostelium fungivorum TaxID=1890364 RepID=A0A2P6N1Q3_9EUKA|nr:hypothetical protein PROFUN_08543 [Planoprotostelium fungivorum]